MALDGLGDLGDERGLGCLVEVFLHIRVGDAVAQDLVAALPESLWNVGAVLVDAEIHLGFDRDIEGVEQLEQAPDADPIAVIAHEKTLWLFAWSGGAMAAPLPSPKLNCSMLTAT